jgi:hypothetical protein
MMHIIAHYWPAWIALFVVARLNYAFTVHEARSGSVRVARWFLARGLLAMSIALVAISLLLNLMDYVIATSR